MTQTRIPMHKTKPHAALRYAIAALLLPLVAGCEEEVEDPSFQAWCGDTLCAWDVEAGRIARVGTWHPSDYGVDLVETPTVLSQVTGKPTSERMDADGLDVEPAEVQSVCDAFGGLYTASTNECLWQVSSGTAGCLRFEVIADVEDSAQVQIEVDYGADGSVDHTQPMVASDWEPVSFLTSVPTWPGLMRFRIHKRGTGRAIIAHFGVRVAEECADPVTVDERPLGVACESPTQCAGNVCAPIATWQACSECSADADCGASETCQVVLDEAHPNGAYRACRNAP
ncbi:MAG: hypothetical protein H6726_04800 [Sandaracinaceae bacterium]|nr:hypothetical protein [Sandaracinaceae bacterium]